jgi:plastocyanin
MRQRNWLIVPMLAVLAAGCGGGSDSYGSGPNTSGSTGSKTTSITVKNNVFDPTATTVPVGSTVSWTWAQGVDLHNVTFDDGQKSANQSSGGYSRLFSTAGTYPYRCTNHPGMNGTITVQ